MIELVKQVDVKLISAYASDNMVAMAAWVSHDQDSEERLNNAEGVEKLISFLYRNKHLSPFEHGVFTFKVDVPLFVAREFMRHRTASYNEVSGRYSIMKSRFYIGDKIRVQQGKPGNYFFVDGDDDQWALYAKSKEKSVARAWKEYERRLEAGIAKEQAREDLPLSLMTQFYVTMNPRNLMQFLTLRNESHALKEIRDVAVKMEEVFAATMPMTYKAYIAGREAEPENVEALKAQIKKLESDLSNAKYLNEKMTKDINFLDTQVGSLQSAKADVERKYADMVAKYNADFVTPREAKKEQEINNNYQLGAQWENKAREIIIKLGDIDPQVVADKVMKELRRRGSAGR